MAKLEPDLNNQKPSPANTGAGGSAQALSSATPAPAPQSARSSASTPTSVNAAKNPAPTTIDPKKGPAGTDPRALKRAYREIPNETYVRRHKQKRIALVVLSVSSIGCFALGLVAFFGNTSGQFTVKIDSKADLTMDTDGSFDKKTSYLKATGLENASTTYADYLPDDDVLDNSTGGAKNGYFVSENHPEYSVGKYMAYTFYVKNVATEDSLFNLTLNIDAYKNGINQACSLVDIVRLRIYDNKVVEGDESSQTHGCRTYAKISKDGVNPELVSYENATKNENKTAAETFLSDKIVLDENYILGPQKEYRYTVAMWLEGWDPDCAGTAPEQAYVSFSMFFSVL